MTLSHGARLAIAGFVLVSAAGVVLRPALPVDETRYLAVAWEMHLSGNGLVPTKNFALYSDKPPLLFWCMNLLWSLTGVFGSVARMVGPIWAAVAIWLTGRLAGRLWPQDPGMPSRAVLALVAMTVFVIAGGLTMFDAMLSVPVLLGLLALVAAGGEGRRPWLAFGACLALGGLAKGPVILLHLLPAALALPLWHPAAPPWRRVRAGLALSLAAGLALIGLWLVPAIIRGGPAYREAILWTQSAGRMGDSFAHARPWWFFVALAPVLLFPWLWMPAIWAAARRAPWREEPGLRLCLIWIGSAALAFSLISGKQPHYLLPELPAIALLAARLGRGISIRPGPALLPVLLIAAVALVFGAGLLQPRGVAALIPQSGYLAAGLAILALVWTSHRIGGFGGMSALSLGLALLANLLVGLTDLGPEYDSGRIAARIEPYAGEGIAFSGRTYHAEFNFAARLRAPVALPGDAQELAAWTAAHPAGVLIAPLGRVDPSWPPFDSLSYRGTPYGLWRAANAPRKEPAP